MKLAAIVVTYKMDTEILLENIKSYADCIDTLILRDNNEFPIDLSIVQKQYPSAIILQNGENIGLAAAYNQAIEVANKQQCTHLMTMDQDSKFEFFDEYCRQLEKNADQSVGIFTCPINHDITESGYRETTVCQSGSIYTMNMLQNIGGFRDDLFIGMVDAEMSLRAIEKGYKIYQITGCNLIQHIGSERIVKILGKEVVVSDYNPLRHYYDSRNRILLWHEFPNDFALQHKLIYLWSRTKLMAKIAFFEQDKLTKIKAILSGTWHGLRNHAIPFNQ